MSVCISLASMQILFIYLMISVSITFISIPSVHTYKQGYYASRNNIGSRQLQSISNICCNEMATTAIQHWKNSQSESTALPNIGPSEASDDPKKVSSLLDISSRILREHLVESISIIILHGTTNQPNRKSKV